MLSVSAALFLLYINCLHCNVVYYLYYMSFIVSYLSGMVPKEMR